MTIDRRSFLRAAAAFGVSVADPLDALAHPAGPAPMPPRVPPVRAYEPYDGPLYVFLSAVGGWDPVALCDPKGSVDPTAPDRISHYTPDQIGTAGNIKYAPVEGNREFFEKHASRLLILNGIDTQTNNHDAGQRAITSGRLPAGNPALPALISAVHAPSHPLSYMSFGGTFDRTEGIIARTTIGSMSSLPYLANPGLGYPDCEPCKFLEPGSVSALRVARAKRRQSLDARQHLPRSERALGALFAARAGADELRRIQDFLPDEPNQSGNPLFSQAQLVLAAYRSGLAISAILRIDTFDTHHNHDALHFPLLKQFLEGMDFLWQQAESFGLAERLVIVAGSDFGRTPFYNKGGGKDHWPVTSMMLMGQGIAGGRVIGATNEGLEARELDPVTLEVVDRGEPLRPAHIHRSLRKLAAVDDHELAEFFPLSGVDLPLLG